MHTQICKSSKEIFQRTVEKIRIHCKRAGVQIVQGSLNIIQGFLYGLKKNFGYFGYNVDGSMLNDRLFFYCACPHMRLILNICMPNFA